MKPSIQRPSSCCLTAARKVSLQAHNSYHVSNLYVEHAAIVNIWTLYRNWAHVLIGELLPTQLFKGLLYSTSYGQV